MALGNFSTGEYMRVHELAKELQADSKILTGILADMGIVIKTHFAALTDEQAEQVRKIYAGGQDKKSSAAAKRPRKKTPKPATKEAEPEAEPAAPAVTSKVVAVATDGQETKNVIEQRMSG
ncbi:MAG: hypothetical protein EHM37_07195, partial [Deltaproteobacteria bacterium]